MLDIACGEMNMYCLLTDRLAAVIYKGQVRTIAAQSMHKGKKKKAYYHAQCYIPIDIIHVNVTAAISFRHYD
jgi:hypothetical protein